MARRRRRKGDDGTEATAEILVGLLRGIMQILLAIFTFLMEHIKWLIANISARLVICVECGAKNVGKGSWSGALLLGFYLMVFGWFMGRCQS